MYKFKFESTDSKTQILVSYHPQLHECVKNNALLTNKPVGALSNLYFLVP